MMNENRLREGAQLRDKAEKAGKLYDELNAKHPKKNPKGKYSSDLEIAAKAQK